jgi:S1-C subfamily serine protease
MKQLIPYLFLLVFHQLQVFSQSSDAQYFDQSGKSTSKANAYYFREKKPDVPNGYISKYPNGNIAFEGVISDVHPTDENKNKYKGTCTWYYKNGSKKAVRTFDDAGIETGKTTLYFESGKIWKIFEWEKGKLKNRKYQDFDEKGNAKLVFEEEFENNSNDWDLYSSKNSKAEIKNGLFELTSLNKIGTTRFIRVDNESNEYSYEIKLENDPKTQPKGKHGLIFGFKDWQNYHYYLIDGQYLHIGEVFEGVTTKRANGFFSSKLFSKPQEINLKVFGTSEKTFYSLNGEIQFTSGKITLFGSGFGPGLSNKGTIKVRSLELKEFNVDAKGPDSPVAPEDEGKYKSTGTGFIISKEGHVVTNHHVVDDAKTMDIQILENGIPKTYKATKLVEDKDNDLAILKITDERFKPFTKIGYAWKLNPAYNVGASIFTIGYPLQSVLGQEAKFVDGKISAKTGYKNSISSFQTSVPIQPGNSGSPLFNDKGELIGVMNALVTNTDNVSYAVKLTYLQNLVDLLPTPIEIPASGFPAGTSLEDMIKALNPYISLIKIK